MAALSPFDYKSERNRYSYYYQRLQVFYQKPVTQVSVAVLLTIGTIIFFGLFAIRPTLQTISELLRKIDDQKAVLSLAEKKSAALATAQAQYVQIEPDLPLLDAAIPQADMIQSVLRSIESIAGTAAIPVTDIHIGKLEYPPAKTSSDVIQELKFTITLKTTYGATKQFITALSQLPRLITIDGVYITTNKNNNQVLGEQDGILETSINCRTFYQSPKMGNE